jgi:hypothetical protein
MSHPEETGFEAFFPHFGVLIAGLKKCDCSGSEASDAAGTGETAQREKLRLNEKRAGGMK